MRNKLKYIAENLDSLKIGLDETFKFNCTMCGKCCIERDDIMGKVFLRVWPLSNFGFVL